MTIADSHWISKTRHNAKKNQFNVPLSHQSNAINCVLKRERERRSAHDSQRITTQIPYGACPNMPNTSSSSSRLAQTIFKFHLLSDFFDSLVQLNFAILDDSCLPCIFLRANARGDAIPSLGAASSFVSKSHNVPIALVIQNCLTKMLISEIFRTIPQERLTRPSHSDFFFLSFARTFSFTTMAAYPQTSLRRLNSHSDPRAFFTFSNLIWTVSIVCRSNHLFGYRRTMSMLTIGIQSNLLLKLKIQSTKSRSNKIRALHCSTAVNVLFFIRRHIALLIHSVGISEW